MGTGMETFDDVSGFFLFVKLDLNNVKRYIKFWMLYLVIGVQHLVINSIYLFTVRKNPLPKLIERTLY